VADRIVEEHDPQILRSEGVEPKFQVPDRPSKLDPFVNKLLIWLRHEAGNLRKQKRTTKQLHADLVTLGYDGSYARVAAFVRRGGGPLYFSFTSG
jgi:hypothetical protein